MKVEKIDNGDLSSKLTVVLEPSDYSQELKKQLNEYRKTAHIKGFRKGKTPMSAIRKMYGKGVLTDVIHKKLNKTLEDYIVEEKLDILGNPLPSEDQEVFEFDISNPTDYTFIFDVGVAPEFEVSGVGAGEEYLKYSINLTDDDLNEEIEALQKRMGKQEETDLPIEDKDILTLKIVEKGSASEEPYTTEITVMPERMGDEYEKKFKGQSKGFTTEINIYDLEANASEDYVKKYFLKDAPAEVQAEFDAEVTVVKRLVPAEINEEFFQTAFGNEEIKDLDAAKSKLKEDLGAFYESQALSITKRKILLRLIDQNDLEMPDAFLKRWLLATNGELTEEQVENDYEGFVKNLRWTLIKNKLSASYEIEITPDDIKNAFIEKTKAQFAQYGYGMMGDFDYGSMAERMMQNQESVQKEYDEILAERVLDQVLENVLLKEEVVTTEEYKKIVEDLSQNNQ